MKLYSENCGFEPINIPDETFKEYLLNSGINSNKDEEISYLEASLVNDETYTSNTRKIDISSNFSENKIKSVKGIEHFINITRLKINGQEIKNIDLSNNSKLEIINLQNNDIESILLPSNTSLLTNVNLSKNNISEIDISYENLAFLTIYDNKLESLNLSNNPRLYDVHCNKNQLNLLDLSNLTNINSINCTDNLLECIQVDDKYAVTSNWRKDDTAIWSEDCNYLSNNDFNELEYQIYPNPSKGYLNIDSVVKGSYKIVSVHGKEVAKGKIDKGLNALNLSDLNKGVYLLNFISSGKSKISKIIIE